MKNFNIIGHVFVSHSPILCFEYVGEEDKCFELVNIYKQKVYKGATAPLPLSPSSLGIFNVGIRTDFKAELFRFPFILLTFMIFNINMNKYQLYVSL